MTIQRAWVGFWALAVIWGSSFLFIRIGVEQLSTFQLVFIRTGIAALGLNIVAYLRGKRLPTDWAGVRDLLILGVVNTVFPFALITWGEKSVESGLAAVLQATAALFTMVVAHVVFVDERITGRTLAGLVFGFTGVVVLASRGTDGGAVATGARLHLLGQLAIIAASFCYALGGVYSRKAIQRRLEPIVAAAGAMTVTAVTSGVVAYAAPLVGWAAPVALDQLTSRVLVAILTLGAAEYVCRVPDLLRDHRDIGCGKGFDGDVCHPGSWPDAGGALPGRVGRRAAADRRRDDRRQHRHVFGDSPEQDDGGCD